MLFYHGTDKESADQIQKDLILKGDRGVFGPGICTTVARALNFSAIKCAKYGPRKARQMGRIVVIDLPEEIVSMSSLDAQDAYTLNDEFGKPLKRLPLVRVERVLTISQAQKCLR